MSRYARAMRTMLTLWVVIELPLSLVFVALPLISYLFFDGLLLESHSKKSLEHPEPVLLAVGGVMLVVSLYLLRKLMRYRRVQKRGRPARGMVMAVRETATRVNRARVHLLELEVRLDGAAPYHAKAREMLGERASAMVGGVVPLLVDPKDPSFVVLNGEPLSLGPQAQPNAGPAQGPGFLIH